MRKTITLNFFGGPGCGKSTLAMDATRMLRECGLEAELCPEAAKDLVWDNQVHKLPHYQPWVLGEQYRRMVRLVGETDVIVCESPLLLTAVYDCGRHTALAPLALELHRCFNNLDFFMEREGGYSVVGRREDETEARLVDVAVLQLLAGHGIVAPLVRRGAAELAVRAAVSMFNEASRA